MNLFKITLISVLVAGLACANVSAVDPQDGNQDLERITTENFEKIYREIEASYTEQDFQRLHRARTGTYTQEDVEAGFANLAQIINDPNQDLQLRRIIEHAIDWQQRTSAFTNDELKQIPLATFHKAGALILYNTIGWTQQATTNYVNELIDRHLGQQTCEHIQQPCASASEAPQAVTQITAKQRWQNSLHDLALGGALLSFSEFVESLCPTIKAVLGGLDHCLLINHAIINATAEEFIYWCPPIDQYLAAGIGSTAFFGYLTWKLGKHWYDHVPVTASTN